MRSLVALGGLLAATSVAWGADLPVPASAPAPAVYTPAPRAVYNWTGFYLGANAGWSFATADTTATFTGGPLGGIVETGTSSNNGAVAGGQIGFNYQIDAFVVGLEGDFDWSGISATQSASCGAGCTISQTGKLPWVATLRPRVGFALDRVLLYGTGGAAWTNLSDKITATPIGTIYNASATSIGWTLGAGAEAALAQNWTVRAEYLYVQTDNTLSGALGGIGGSVSQSITLKDSLVRVGVNFKYP